MASSQMRSRSELEQIIRQGGSVTIPHPIHGSIHVARVEDLPPESDLASGDRLRMQAELERLRRQHADTGRQIEALEERLTQPEPPEPEANPPAAPAAPAEPSAPAQAIGRNVGDTPLEALAKAGKKS